MKKKICVILPCHRVKHKIYNVYTKLIKQNIDCIIFVDDFCPQKSVSYLKSKIKKNRKIKYIFLKKNIGVGGATLKGFEKAKKNGFDIIIKFDADNQHRISDLKKIINLLKKKEINFCKGYRNLSLKESFKRKMPLIRIIGATGLTYISRLTTKNFELKDVTNGLFGMNIKTFNKINKKDLKKNYFFEQDLIFRMCKSNIKIIQIKSEVIYNNENSSLNELRSVIPFIYYHLQNFFYKK